MTIRTNRESIDLMLRAQSPMDASDLAGLMLAWEDWRQFADSIERRIQEEVLDRGETVITGNVRATYSKPRKTYHYEQGAAAHGTPNTLDDALIEQYTTTETVYKTDWRALVLGGLKLAQDAIPFTESDPRVTLKIDG